MRPARRILPAVASLLTPTPGASDAELDPSASRRLGRFDHLRPDQRACEACVVKGITGVVRASAPRSIICDAASEWLAPASHGRSKDLVGLSLSLSGSLPLYLFSILRAPRGANFTGRRYQALRDSMHFTASRTIPLDKHDRPLLVSLSPQRLP